MWWARIVTTPSSTMSPAPACLVGRRCHRRRWGQPHAQMLPTTCASQTCPPGVAPFAAPANVAILIMIAMIVSVPLPPQCSRPLGWLGSLQPLGFTMRAGCQNVRRTRLDEGWRPGGKAGIGLCRIVHSDITSSVEGLLSTPLTSAACDTSRYRKA